MFSLCFCWLLSGRSAMAQTSEDLLSKAEDLYRHADYRASLTLVRESGQASGRAYLLDGQRLTLCWAITRRLPRRSNGLSRWSRPIRSTRTGWAAASDAVPRRPCHLFAPKYAVQSAGVLREGRRARSRERGSAAAICSITTWRLRAFWEAVTTKRKQIAQRIAERNPAEGHFAQAELADRRKQFDTAEEQLRRAIQLAPRAKLGRCWIWRGISPGTGRIPESEAAFDQAERLAPNSPRVAFRPRANCTSNRSATWIKPRLC